jgi:hypothetical protein
MATQPKKLTLKEEIRAQKLRIYELHEQYITMLYFETMPDYDPLYKYCYQSSNFTIPGLLQSVDAWIRAVIMHMSQRRPGHGGGYTKALVITPLAFTTENERDNWIDYEINKLRKKVRVVKPKVEKPKYKRGTATKGFG